MGSAIPIPRQYFFQPSFAPSNNKSWLIPVPLLLLTNFLLLFNHCQILGRCSAFVLGRSFGNFFIRSTRSTNHNPTIIEEQPKRFTVTTSTTRQDRSRHIIKNTQKMSQFYEDCDTNNVEKEFTFDMQGSEAIQIRNGKSNIRLERQTEVFHDVIHDKVYRNQQDVLDMIRFVNELQNKHRPSKLYERKWMLNNDDHNGTVTNEIKSGDESSSSFKVLQFNILAEGLSSGPSVSTPFSPHSTENVDSKDLDKKSIIYGGFTDVPKPEISLDFSLRRWRILEVLLSNDFYQNDSDIQSNEEAGQFDIIALEECDRFGFFEPLLSLFGYQALFNPKSFSPGIKFGFYSDGCALFWKHDRFQLLCEERSTYDVGNQVYILSTLKHVETGRILIVVVTHLKAQQNSVSEKVRTAQATQLLEVTQRAVVDASEEYGITRSDIATLIMGDFNSELFDDDDHSCIQTMINGSIDGNLKVKSVYNIDPPDSSYFTTWKTRGEKTVRRIIDYIFHNHQLRCTHTLASPSQLEMESPRLPGFRYPSDHIAIGAKFEISKSIK